MSTTCITYCRLGMQRCKLDRIANSRPVAMPPPPPKENGYSEFRSGTVFSVKIEGAKTSVSNKNRGGTDFEPVEEVAVSGRSGGTGGATSPVRF